MSETEFHIAGEIEGIPDPRAHDHLFGHDAARRQIEHAFTQNRFPQAWLISGAEGIGKATLAWHYARQLVEFGEISPEIRASETLLERYARGGHLSIYSVNLPPDDKGGFKSQIPIESIRKLSEKLAFATTDGGWRAVIIDPAEAMNTAAANAILKLLEEPPAQVVFFLISHAPNRLLPTIRSRCQILRLNGLGQEELSAATRIHGQNVSEDCLRLSEGSVRLALSLSGDMTENYNALLGIFCQKSGRQNALIHLAAKLAREGRNEAYANARQLLGLLFNRVNLVHFGLDQGTENEMAIARKLRRNQTDAFAELALESFAKLDEAMRINLDAEINISRVLTSVDALLNSA